MTHAMHATHAMHRGRGHRHGPGHGCGPGGRRGRTYDREEWLARLEEHQRDLEQETADVADLIRRLKEERPAGTAEV
jgi:hypothetical protein